MHADHLIYTFEYEDRNGWECDCGRGGSVPDWADSRSAAEKHIPEGESFAYTSSPRW